ncbi:MAG: hypothetical protein AAGA08_15570 [Pseudomonadota bacterium]
MIETHHSARVNTAQRIAHQERGQAFAALFRALPKIVSSIRHRS